MSAAAARILEPNEPPKRALTLEALLDLVPDLTTSAGPPATLEPLLSPIEIGYLMGDATPEEAREALAQFSQRAKASPDLCFWTGFDDEDDDDL